MHHSVEQTAMAWNSVPTKQKYSRTAHQGSLREVKKRLDFQDEEENDLDFTDKLKALRGLISPKKHVLVSRELDKRAKVDSENELKLSQKDRTTRFGTENELKLNQNDRTKRFGSENELKLNQKDSTVRFGTENELKLRQRDDEASLKSKDDYYKFLTRPASTGPGITGSHTVASRLTGRHGVHDKLSIQRPCSALELASRLDHVDDQLDRHTFRSPSHKYRDVVHSTPVSESRHHKATKHEELSYQKSFDDQDQKQINGDTSVSKSRHDKATKHEELNHRKRFDDQYQKEMNGDCLSASFDKKDVNNNKKYAESTPDIHTLLERLKKNRDKRGSCKIEFKPPERSHSASVERPHSCNPHFTNSERESVTVQRPKSCYPNSVNSERESVTVQRPKSCYPNSIDSEREAVRSERPKSCYPNSVNSERDAMTVQRPKSCYPDSVNSEREAVRLEKSESCYPNSINPEIGSMRVNRPRSCNHNSINPEKDLVRLDGPQSFYPDSINSERDSVRSERPQSCYPHSINTKKDSLRLERPKSCNPCVKNSSLTRLDHKNVNTSIEAVGFKQNGSMSPHYKDPSIFENHDRSFKKQDLDSSIRQTNVPFFDEVTTPSKKLLSTNTSRVCVSPSNQDEDTHVPIIRSQGSRTPHKYVKDTSEISSHSKDFHSQKLEYVRTLHNEAVADDEASESSSQVSSVDGFVRRRGHSRVPPTDASTGVDGRKSKVFNSEIPCVDVSTGVESKRGNRCQTPVDVPSDVGNTIGKVSTKKSSKDMNGGRSSKLNRQKYLQSFTDEPGGLDCNSGWYVDSAEEERKSLDVCLDSGAGPMTLRQLRELHNRAFGSLDGNVITDGSNSRDVDSNVEKFNEEYFQHKNTWNREQRSYKRNLQHLNDLLDRRTVTPSCDGSSRRHQDNGTTEQRSMTPASYEKQKIQSSKQRMFLDRDLQAFTSGKQHVDNIDHNTYSSNRKFESTNGAERNTPSEKHSLTRSSDRKFESSMNGAEKDCQAKSYTPGFTNKKRPQSGCKPQKPTMHGHTSSSVETGLRQTVKQAEINYLHGILHKTPHKSVESTKVSLDYQRSQTPASYERNLKLMSNHSGRRSVELANNGETERAIKKSGSEKQTRSQTPSSYERNLKLQSNHSGRRSVDLVRDNGEMEMKTSVEKQTRSQTPASYERNLKLLSTHPRRKSVDLPRDNCKTELRKSAEKQTTRSQSPAKLKPRVIKREISPNKFTESKKNITKKETTVSNSPHGKDCSKRFDGRDIQKNSKKGLRKVGPTRSLCVTSMTDAEQRRLYLNDVRKLHFEVDQRLHDNLFSSFDSDSSDDQSTVVEVTAKKGVLDYEGTDLKQSGQFENQDSHVGQGVHNVDTIHRGNSVEVSADITIPELFGMKITKTIKRIGNGKYASSDDEVQQWRNGEGNVKYELTLPSYKQTNLNVTNNTEKNRNSSSSVHRATDNDSNTRSKLLINQNGQVRDIPGQNRVIVVNGISRQNEVVDTSHVIGKMNEDSDTEIGNSQIDCQRFQSITSQDGNSYCVSVDRPVCWSRTHQTGTPTGLKQDGYEGQCDADVGEYRVSRQGQNSYEAQNSIDDEEFHSRHKRYNHPDQNEDGYGGQSDADEEYHRVSRQGQNSYAENRNDNEQFHSRHKRWDHPDQNQDVYGDQSDVDRGQIRVSRQGQNSYHTENSSDDEQCYGRIKRGGYTDQEDNYWCQDGVSEFSHQAQEMWVAHDGDQNRLNLPSAGRDFLDGLPHGRSYNMVDCVNTANVTRDSRLIFEPPERDLSKPLQETSKLSKLNQPISNGFINSPYTAADTIIASLDDPGAVRLLKQLYSANESVRPDLIVKAQYFKTWQRNVNHVSEHRRQYGHSLQQAYCFHVNHLTGKYFHQWLSAAISEQQNRKATLLYRQMMLRKGLGAFKWAISRSRHHHDIMQSRVESILLTTAFVKWRQLTVEKQRCRLSETFRAWQNLTVEVQSLRVFEKSMNEKLCRKSLTKWKDVFVVRAKQHRADAYNRRTLLKHMFETWTTFTSLSKQQAQRHQTAINQYRLILQKKMFGEMIMVHRKYQKAKWHYGHRKLVQFFGAWQQVIQVCKLEQEQDIQTSTDHWNLTTTRSYFIHWKVVLGNLRAKRIANKNLLRHTFVKWKATWQQENERRRSVEQRIKKNKVCLAFRCWRKNVVTRRRRQRKAIVLLERQLLLQQLHDWCYYTKYKKELNKKLKFYINSCNRRRLSESFKIWHQQFQQKVDADRARKFWSDKCVMKCVRKWQHVCRKRRLRCLLVETEPDRQLRCLEVMFYRWLATKHQMDVEKCEVNETRLVLDLCQLKRRFQIWRLATLQALTIKPLVLCKQKKLVTRCFGGWVAITRHKAECQRSRVLFLKTKLRRTFVSWRRQYFICQLGKEIRHKTDMGLLVCCLQEWSCVLQRKHTAHKFNERKCVRHMFTYWKSRTAWQLQSKADAHHREEENVCLKRFYLNAWLSNMQLEMAETDDAINMLQQRQAYNRIRRSFASWRDHLHATFIGRAYHKNMCQRLMRTVMVEWHLVADHSLADAVQRFADQLGLPVMEERDSSGRSDGSFTSLSGYHSNSRDVNAICDVESEMGVNSPRSASSTTCSFRRLFGATESDRSEPDGMSLIGHALDSCQLEEKLARADRIKLIVFTVVKRLRHWPISVLFDQWKEFTARQLELKRLMARLAEIHDRCVLTLTLREWRQNYLAVLLAKKHRSNILLSRTFAALQCYVQRRKEKAKLSGVAKKHHMMVVFQKVFPLWLAKTQEQQHNKHILHLWSTTTTEEKRLIPLEVQLCRQFSRRSLTLCFSVWFLKHKFTAKIKHVYYTGLIKRSFICWSQWAHEQRERNQKCVEFKQRRILSMTFKTWCQHLQQKRETERRFTLAWSNYLQVIVQTWTAWARANRSRRFLARQLIDKQDQNTLRQRFAYWHSLTSKVLLVKTRSDRLLLTSVVQQWRQVVVDKQKMQQKILEFRVKCYTRNVKVLFRKWCDYHAWCLRVKQTQEAYRQNQALVLARTWRKKAQASRGQRLHTSLAVNKVRTCFSKWKLAFQKCLDREDVLQRHLSVQHRVCLSAALETWHTHYLGNQAERVFNLKLQATFLEEWSHWAKASKERRIRGLALQRALEERTLHVYFKYWLGLMQVQQSVRTHVGLKIQIRVLQGWHFYVQRRQQLAQSQKIMTRKVNLRIMTSTFMTLRCQFDYCQGLSDVANQIITKKNRVLIQKKLRLWQLRLDTILASRCYGKFLAVRVVRQWRKFVQKRADERQMEKDHTELAIRHYNKKICKLVVSALHNQVLASRQCKQHRERTAMRFAKQWKHQVDLAHTAHCVEEERIYEKTWICWRLQFARRKAANNMELYNKRQLLTKIFAAWHQMSQKKKRRKSSIPVAVTSGQGQMPSRSSIPVPVNTRNMSDSLRRSRFQHN